MYEHRHGEMLRQAGNASMLDYWANAGGTMGASTGIFAEPSRQASIWQIDGLQDSIRNILTRAEAEGRSTSEIAVATARERLARKAVYEWWPT